MICTNHSAEAQRISAVTHLLENPQKIQNKTETRKRS
jgi:hypothetical protein